MDQANKVKILQINSNRSRPAHDMALEAATRIEAGILIISEPNRNAIRSRKDWVYGEDLNTAIKIMPPGVTVRRQGQGPGYTYIDTGNFTIYSCYSSGNDELENLERTLDEIGNLVTTRNEKAIIAGDFNAKSPQWVMQTSDRRGQVLTE